MIPVYQAAAIFAVGVIWLCTRLWKKWRGNPHGLSYPPGPKQTPIFGNPLPNERSWLAYTEWGKQYRSDILHSHSFGAHYVILNSYEDATELFERRSRIYSDRPYLPVLDIFGFTTGITLSHYGDHWRRGRRILHQGFKQSEVPIYHPLQARKVRGLLRDLLKTPESFRKHHRAFAGAVILATAYGDDVSSTNQQLVSLVEGAIKYFIHATIPGKANLINALPILQYFPSWFPGAGFKKSAEECKVITREMRGVPFKLVRKAMALGTATPSFLSRALEKFDSSNRPAVEEEIIKIAAGSTYTAGVETSTAVLQVFFHAMAIYPTVQRRAQEEIDRVIGTGRLPGHADRGSLPYVEALFREILRWKPPAPLAIPHASMKDDVYKGYFIPKGSVVLSNVWAMTHDDRVYANPEVFNPERFFDGDGKLNTNDMSIIFGIGRRICPGRHIARSILWLAIASILSTFDIAKLRDAKGREIEIDDTYSDAVTSYPMPFQCSITPRSDEACRLVEEDDQGRPS